MQACRHARTRTHKCALCTHHATRFIIAAAGASRERVGYKVGWQVPAVLAPLRGQVRCRSTHTYTHAHAFQVYSHITECRQAGTSMCVRAHAQTQCTLARLHAPNLGHGAPGQARAQVPLAVHTCLGVGV